jgi:hypothetical protein
MRSPLDNKHVPRSQFQISVHFTAERQGSWGPDRRHQDLRIENALADEQGDGVKLKKGAHVEATVRAKPETATAAIDEDSQLTQRVKTILGFGRHNTQFSYQRAF